MNKTKQRKPRQPAPPPEQDDFTPEKIAELKRGVLRRRIELGWVFDEGRNQLA